MGRQSSPRDAGPPSGLTTTSSIIFCAAATALVAILYAQVAAPPPPQPGLATDDGPFSFTNHNSSTNTSDHGLLESNSPSASKPGPALVRLSRTPPRSLEPQPWQAFLPTTKKVEEEQRQDGQGSQEAGGDDSTTTPTTTTTTTTTSTNAEKEKASRKNKEKKQRLSTHQRALRTIIAGGKPVLIPDSPATQWPALQGGGSSTRWSWEYLSSRIAYIRDVRNQSNDPIFRLREDGVNGGMIGGKEQQTVFNVPKMSFRDFLSSAGDPSQYLYYTTALDRWRPPPSSPAAAAGRGLDEDVHWQDLAMDTHDIISPLHRHDKDDRGGAGGGLKVTTAATSSSNDSSSSGGGTAGSSSSVAMVWASHPGVTAQCHYDKSHNFFVQVLGHKRFTLYPPSQHSHLYEYPSLHVSKRQSQVDFTDHRLLHHRHHRDDSDDDGGASFPLVTKAKPLQVDVGPGDLLYIPPYWYHMVETLQHLSLSISVVSPSAQEFILSQAYWTLLPFKSLESTMERVVGAQTYLVHLISRAKGTVAPWKIAQWLYRTRYSHLYPKTGLFMSNSHFTCYQDQVTEVAVIRDRLSKKDIIDTATAVANIINRQEIGKAIRQTWLGDYIEEIARWAMGGPESVPLFITECLHFEPVPVVEEIEGPSVIKMEREEE